MFGIIVGTHGRFAEELVKSCEMICGEQKNVRAVTLVPGEGPDDVVRKYETAIKELDCVIVPGAAFDVNCNRLGKGGSFYDKFLKLAVNAKKIALAYDFQIVDDLPTEAHDTPVDLVITPTRLITAGDAL